LTEVEEVKNKVCLVKILSRIIQKRLRRSIK